MNRTPTEKALQRDYSAPFVWVEKPENTIKHRPSKRSFNDHPEKTHPEMRLQIKSMFESRLSIACISQVMDVKAAHVQAVLDGRTIREKSTATKTKTKKAKKDVLV